MPPDDARRAADEILSRPEYREPEPSLVERVLTAVGDFLGDAIGALTGSGPGSVVATLVVVGLVVVAVGSIIRSIGAGRHGVSRYAEPSVRGTAAPDDPSTWLAEAARHVAAGDLRRALRCRYQAMVAALLRDGVVDDVPGRTPRELAAELVALAPALEDRVRAVSDDFERAWYGGAPVTDAQYQRFTVAASAIEGLRRAHRHRQPQGAPA